jgi:hypothetical protein
MSTPAIKEDTLLGDHLYSGGKVSVSMADLGLGVTLHLQDDEMGEKCRTLTHDRLAELYEKWDHARAVIPTGPFGRWLRDQLHW